MRTPLGKPPGRQKWFARMGPAWWAAAVYAVFAAAFLWNLLAEVQGQTSFSRRASEPVSPLIVGTIFSWPLACAIMFVGAIVSGAMALAPEHSRGTMDALLMTPADHTKLARGRYWHCLAPWLRFFVYVLPLYVLLSGTAVFSEASRESGESFSIISTICSFSNKAILTFGLIVEGLRRGTLEWEPWSIVLLILRAANDLSILLLAYSLAFYISARVHSSNRALGLASFIVPAAVIIVVAPHDLFVVVMLVIAKAFRASLGRSALDVMVTVYGVLGVATFLARWVLAWWLARAACRNFHRWATDARAG